MRARGAGKCGGLQKSRYKSRDVHKSFLNIFLFNHVIFLLLPWRYFYITSMLRNMFIASELANNSNKKAQPASLFAVVALAKKTIGACKRLVCTEQTCKVPILRYSPLGNRIVCLLCCGVRGVWVRRNLGRSDCVDLAEKDHL